MVGLVYTRNEKSPSVLTWQNNHWRLGASQVSLTGWPSASAPGAAHASRSLALAKPCPPRAGNSRNRKHVRSVHNRTRLPFSTLFACDRWPVWHRVVSQSDRQRKEINSIFEYNNTYQTKLINYTSNSTVIRDCLSNCTSNLYSKQ